MQFTDPDGRHTDASFEGLLKTFFGVPTSYDQAVKANFSGQMDFGPAVGTAGNSSCKLFTIYQNYLNKGYNTTVENLRLTVKSLIKDGKLDKLGTVLDYSAVSKAFAKATGSLKYFEYVYSAESNYQLTAFTDKDTAKKSGYSTFEIEYTSSIASTNGSAKTHYTGLYNVQTNEKEVDPWLPDIWAVWNKTDITSTEYRPLQELDY